MKEIQGVAWNTGCSGCIVRVLLQEVICRAGWWDYHMLIALFGGMVKTVAEYMAFWEATEN